MMGGKQRFPIVIEDLSFRYNEKDVLRSISLSIEKNKFYCIIGPNGCGKTTLLKNISGNVEHKAGRVLIDNNEIRDMRIKEVARKISFVPQNTTIDFEFTALDVVMMGRSPYLRLFQNEGAKDLEIACEAMKSTNTWHLKDKNINQISGGERQRVIVARALAQQTGILLMDEPISMLDIHHQIELMDTIKKLVINSDVTVVAVLHDLNMAAQYSDEIILMNSGEIVAKGMPEAVITEENLMNVYGLRASVIKNPVTGKPHVLPLSTIA